MISSLKLQISLIATRQYNLYSQAKDMLLSRDSKSAFKGNESIPMNGRHKALSQLSISRAHTPSNHVVLCHCHCYNMVLFESLELLVDDVAILITGRKRDYFFPPLMVNIVITDLFSLPLNAHSLQSLSNS